MQSPNISLFTVKNRENQTFFTPLMALASLWLTITGLQPKSITVMRMLIRISPFAGMYWLCQLCVRDFSGS